MKPGRFTWSEQVRLLGRAVRPDELQYIVFYHSPFAAALQAVTTWSPNGLDCVRGEFLNDFYDERPRVLLLACISPN